MNFKKKQLSKPFKLILYISTFILLLLIEVFLFINFIWNPEYVKNSKLGEQRMYLAHQLAEGMTFSEVTRIMGTPDKVLTKRNKPELDSNMELQYNLYFESFQIGVIDLNEKKEVINIEFPIIKS